MPHLLSKSKYIRGLQCDRALWLDVHKPRLARYTAEQMRRFERGREFEYAFKSQFPDAVDLSVELKRNVDAYPGRTAQLLDHADAIDLFEAGFLYDDVLVLADVVHQNPDGTLDIYEVKSGATLSETYRCDAALQHYVIAHCREVRRFSLVYRNPGYPENPESPENPEHPEFPYSIEDITDYVQSRQSEIARNIAVMKQIVLASSEPDTPTGQHCLEPYACPYRHYCAQGVRQLALF